MKFHWKHPDGWEISASWEPKRPREPMEREKFYALVCLAAGALVVTLFLGSIALR